jgi:hypothetical protein
VDTIGDLDQLVAQFQRPRDNCGEIEDVALSKGMRRVAVVAPPVTGRQPDQHAGKTRERAFSLQASINLMEEQAPGRFVLERL